MQCETGISRENGSGIRKHGGRWLPGRPQEARFSGAPGGAGSAAALRVLATTFILIMVVHAAPPPAPGANSAGAPFGMPGPFPHPRLEKAAYVGVSLSRASAPVRTQLGLAEGVGLVATYVAPDGPASKVLHPFDVLTRLDDQILVNPEQAAVLVRMHKPGDEVTIAFIRAGQRKEAKITLGEKELPPIEVLFPETPVVPLPMPSIPGFPSRMFPRPQPGMVGGGGRRAPGHPVREGGAPPPPAPGAAPGAAGAQPGRPAPPPDARPGAPAPPVRPPMARSGPPFQGNFSPRGRQIWSGVSTISRNGLTVVLTTDTVRGKHLICLARNGAIVFNGPINTARERDGVPAPFRPLLEQAEKKTAVTMPQPPPPGGAAPPRPAF